MIRDELLWARDGNDKISLWQEEAKENKLRRCSAAHAKGKQLFGLQFDREMKEEEEEVEKDSVCSTWILLIK